MKKNYKYSCVVDAAGYYKTLVLILIEPDYNGEIKENVQCYELKEGEILLAVGAPSGLVKPRWNGSEWIEGATSEEIAAWEKEHPAPPAPEPAPVDILGAQVAQLTIENIRKDQIINALGAQVAQTSLDMIELKGGA